MESYYIGIDVGTGSARAAIVDSKGSLLAESSRPIQTFRNPKDHRHFEQSTTDIWESICVSIKKVLAESKVSPEKVKGVGVDATCSLAVADRNGAPVNISENSLGKGHQNVILWADHRAVKEANLINSTGSNVLKYVGGKMSLEMELPKILWLKNHMPKEMFDNCMFFDLPDFLSYYMTDSLQRSNCSLVCKCGYVPPGVEGSEGWNRELLRTVGLESIIENRFSQVGGLSEEGQVLSAGQPVGKGLSKKAAEECGLVAGTPVGSAVIDAYAGWIGTVAAKEQGKEDAAVSVEESQHRLAVIAGTSTCHIVQSKEPVFVPGVWGPFNNALFDGYWCNEGGQSSTGQLIDFFIDTHPARADLDKLAKEHNVNIFTYLEHHLKQLQQDRKCATLSHLTRDVLIYPDAAGNRSPIADPSLKAIVTGITLDRSVDDLAIKYYAVLEAIGLQTRQIVQALNDKGHKITKLYMSGGHAKNPLFMHLLALTCNMPVHLPHNVSASVVLGSAMLGAMAEKLQTSKESNTNKVLWDIMALMTKSGGVVLPKETGENEAKLLDVKYEIFMDMFATQKKYQTKVREVAGVDA